MTTLILAIAILWGYTCNALRLDFIHPKDIQHSLSQEFLSYMRYYIPINNFVETGTFAGGSTRAALAVFPNIYTIELDNNLFSQACNIFSGLPHVHLYNGDSGLLLRTIIPLLQGSTLFWLDAHYSGTGTAFAGYGTPILEELDAIASTPQSTSPLILVDDIRLFGQKFTYETQAINQSFPDFAQLITKLRTINPNFSFALLGDTLLAFDPALNITLSPVVQACTQILIADSFNMDDPTIAQHESVIYNCNGAEKATFRQLYGTFCLPESNSPSPYYHIWYGLTLMHDRFYHHAAQQFKWAIELGYDTPRIQRYLQTCHDRAPFSRPQQQIRIYLR